MKPTLLLVLLLGLCAGAERGCNPKLLKDTLLEGGEPIRRLHDQTLQSCQDACTKEPRCGVFNFYHNRRNDCWLNAYRENEFRHNWPGITSGYSLKDCLPGCNPALLKDRLLEGGESIRRLHDQTLQSCQDACTKEPRCGVFNFFHADFSFTDLRNGCLLNTYSEIEYSDHWTGITSGYSLKDCKPDQCKKLMVNVALSGPHFMGIRDVASAEDCQQRCSQDSRCHFFNYLRQDFTRDKGKKYCYLSGGSPKGKRDDRGVTSGYSLTKCP